jgi:hypothetical protein
LAVWVIHEYADRTQIDTIATSPAAQDRAQRGTTVKFEVRLQRLWGAQLLLLGQTVRSEAAPYYSHSRCAF